MFQFSNRARSILARNITAGDTTLIIASGTGAEFPSPAAPGDAIALTLVSASNSRRYEVVYCVQRQGDTFTVWRGQEGTTPLPFQSGDLISLNMTAALFRRMTQAGYLGQFSQEVAQSPSAYRKGAIVCDGTDTAVYWISLEDQNGTTPGEGNPTWMKLSLPELLDRLDRAEHNSTASSGLLPASLQGVTLDSYGSDFFLNEKLELTAKLLQKQQWSSARQKEIRFQQKLSTALSRIGVTL